MDVCVYVCVWVRRSVFLSNLCSGQHACQTSLGVLENGYPVLFRLSDTSSDRPKSVPLVVF